MFPGEVPWFVVLPDTDDSTPVLRRLHERVSGLREVTHASGRPWLAGRWDDRQFAMGRAGDRAVVVLGEHAVVDEWLADRVSRVSDVRQLDELSGRVAGNVHLVASVGGEVRAQGDASGMRRLFHGRVHGVPVASDHGNVLARLQEASVDPGRLAARLLFTAAPWPLGWNPPWTTVEAVWPGHYLHVDRTGRTREVRWWRPPPVELPLARAAEMLRDALAEAVRVRARPGVTVAAHLSGLDSSSLVSLATREGATVVALTAAQPDVLDEDVRWASQTVADLRAAGNQLEHDILPATGEVPLVYAGILSARDGFDEPFHAQHNREPFRYILRRGEQHRQQVHLVGLGGDEICGTASQLLPPLLRRHPVIALRYLRALTAKSRWSWAAAARSVMTSPSQPSWFAETARKLPNHDLDMNRPDFGDWGAVPTLPRWVTPEAVELVRTEMLRAGEQNRTLDPERGRHVMLASVHWGAQMARGFRQLAAAEGVTASAPFFDDQVLAAALSLRSADRFDLSRYKAVLVDAMRGVVPDATLTRTTKSTTPMNAVLGSRKHRDQIVGLAEDCQLARLGIVDATRFRAYCRGPIMVESYSERLEPTLCAEIWLRDQVGDAVATMARRSA